MLAIGSDRDGRSLGECSGMSLEDPGYSLSFQVPASLTA